MIRLEWCFILCWRGTMIVSALKSCGQTLPDELFRILYAMRME